MSTRWTMLAQSARRVVDHGTREEMLRWLQTDDPNGCYVDSCAEHEGIRRRLRKPEAREMICQALTEGLTGRSQDLRLMPRYCWRRFSPKVPAGRAGLRGCGCGR